MCSVTYPTLYFPSHLTCPFCPAQAMPQYEIDNVKGVVVKRYKCPANHIFFVPEDRTHDHSG